MAASAFSSSFNSSQFGSGSISNAAHGGLKLILSTQASARIRKPRDIAGTIKNELSSSQTTLSNLESMLTQTQRKAANTLQSQLSTAQKTLSQLISILPN